jgi:hypothetical protein
MSYKIKKLLISVETHKKICMNPWSNYSDLLQLQDRVYEEKIKDIWRKVYNDTYHGYEDNEKYCLFRF